MCNCALTIIGAGKEKEQCIWLQSEKQHLIPTCPLKVPQKRINNKGFKNAVALGEQEVINYTVRERIGRELWGE